MARGLTVDPSTLPSGGQARYEVEVTNTGFDPADDAAVALLLPEGTTFLGAETSDGTCNPPSPQHPRVVTCQLGDMAAGIEAPPGSTLTALAVANSATPDPDTRDNNAITTSPVA